MPALQTLTASRNATWGPTLNYDYQGQELPLTGATIAMQLRLFPGQPLEAKLSLEAIPFTDDLTAGVAGTATERRRLTLSPVATPTMLSVLPITGERGSDDLFAFDILITYADGVSEILSRGTFILTAGGTIA